MADDREGHMARTMSFGIPDTALGLVMGYHDVPWYRDAISLVCRHWCRLGAESRKHVTITSATTPDRLLRRFPCLESPSIRELSAFFTFLKALHLRRMFVSDDDLALLVRAKAPPSSTTASWSLDSRPRWSGSSGLAAARSGLTTTSSCHGLAGSSHGVAITPP